MSYEYKKEIIEDVKAHCKTKNKNIAVYPVYHYEDKVEEIHSVYSQAAKADEYEAKAKAYDDIRYAMEMQTAIGVSDEDTLIDIEHVIMRLIERREGGGSGD